ncbi:hypothetical protein DSO57_1015479 [Entomophthora muscae]|uniref:Uncharacterized protein n=1 Tax=Entomophthora muscae TaxID=34485 RepID=A0ACC2TFP6_9FUNG|nr:hypothetical protein DSO57_1015479 [Entomophthora muscae]
MNCMLDLLAGGQPTLSGRWSERPSLSHPEYFPVCSSSGTGLEFKEQVVVYPSTLSLTVSDSTSSDTSLKPKCPLEDPTPHICAPFLFSGVLLMGLDAFFP